MLRQALGLAWASVKLPRFDQQELSRAIAVEKEGLSLDKLTNNPAFWLERASKRLKVEGVDLEDDRGVWARSALRALRGLVRNVLPTSVQVRVEVWLALRQLARLEDPGALQRIALAQNKALGASRACDWSWVFVGALPPDDELEKILVERLSAFDARPRSTLVHARGDSSPVEAAQEQDGMVVLDVSSTGQKDDKNDKNNKNVKDKEEKDSLPAGAGADADAGAEEVAPLRFRSPNRVAVPPHSTYLRGVRHVDVHRNTEEQSNTSMVWCFEDSSVFFWFFLFITFTYAST